MSSLLSMMLLTLLTATAKRSGTASNQPTRRGRPVVVPTSWPRSRDARPDLVEQLGRERPRTDARRVRLHHADDLVDLERPDAAAGARAAGDRVAAGHVGVACRGRGRAACPAPPRAARARRAPARPGPARSCRRCASRAARPSRAPARRGRRGRSGWRPSPRAAVLVGQDALELLRSTAGRADPPSARRPARPDRRRRGRSRGRVVPTSAPASRASRAASSATWYGMITWALRLTRTRDGSMPRSASMAISSISVSGLTTTPLPMTGVMCGWSTPDGTRWSLKTSSPSTTVWPALSPPW